MFNAERPPLKVLGVDFRVAWRADELCFLGLPILAGYYEGNKRLFAGKVRQGVNLASRGRLLEAMRPTLQTDVPSTICRATARAISAKASLPRK
jgi:hypothetical protein